MVRIFDRVAGALLEDDRLALMVGRVVLHGLYAAWCFVVYGALLALVAGVYALVA